MEEVQGEFTADCFAAPSLDDGSRITILFEHFGWSRLRGRIDAVDWSEAGFTQPRSDLDSPHHLSYPFLLLLKGEAPSFIPEHAEAREVSLYSLQIRGSSRRTPIIVEQELIDSTILQHAGKFWLFATRLGDAVNPDLIILHSDFIIGRWRFHARNPVNSNLANPRPAGQFLKYKNALLRPAQNCRDYYGQSIIVNRIVRLSEGEFIETSVSQLKPLSRSAYEFGLHTLTHLKGVTVLDGARFQSRLHPALDRFSEFLRWS